MPVYVWRCTRCGLDFETTESIAEHTARVMRDDVPCCPACGGRGERVIGAATVVLRGEGWERDGYGPAGARVQTGGGRRRKGCG